MKVFYNEETKGFYQLGINKEIPKNSIETTEAIRDKLLYSMSKGYRIVVKDGIIDVEKPSVDSVLSQTDERYWRDSELIRSDQELNKVQDSDPKAVGSVSEWRNYRKALRAWPEHRDFPNKEFRPISPDV